MSASASFLSPRAGVRRTVAVLEPVSSWWLLAVVTPVLLTVAVITLGYVASGGTDPGFPPRFPTLVYGLANVAVLSVLFLAWDTERWRAIALFRRPSRAETIAGVLATVVGVLFGWPATTLLSDALGIGRYTPPTLTSVAGIVAIGFGAVLVAPVAEEVLYRGLFVGIGLERGYSSLAVGAVSLFAFAVVHVITGGVAGVLNALLLGSLLTWLRFRFDNLAGAWLVHTLNNLLEFLVALSVLPSLYAL
jgi:membrane protease YdiL (CAAX protease family)